MKNQLLLGLLGAAGAFALAGSMASCSDNYSPATDSDGQLMVKLGLDKEVVSSRPAAQAAPASRADAMAVDASDLTLKITSDDGKFSHEYAVAELASPVTVPVGKYNVEAFYGSATDEGFEMPYYYGSSSISVIENRATTVNVTAQLANSMVRVEMSEIFQTYFESYKVSLRSELGTEYTYAADETRPLYLAPGQVTTTIEITKKDGTKATLEPKSFTAEARHSYVLQFDINGGSGADDAFLTLTYDDLCDMEEVEIDLSSEILNAPVPRLTTEGFESGDTWTVMPGNRSSKDAKVSVYAQGGLDGVVLTTTSAWLQQQGWPAEIDLVGADAATLATMKALGLRAVGTDKPAKMALVDLTDVLSNIQYISGGDNTATFTIQARDKNQRVAEQPVEFTVEVTTTSLSVVKVYPVVQWGTKLELDIRTNAMSLDGLTVSSQKESGSYGAATITSVEPVEGQEGVYHVVADGITSTDKDLKVRVQLGSLRADITVVHVESPYELAATGADVYGWQAVVSINDISTAAAPRKGKRRAAVSGEVSFEASTDGTTWTSVASSTLADGRYLVKGFKGNTTYRLRAKVNGTMSKVFIFTTETGEQIYNFGMEDWYSKTGNKTYGLFTKKCYWTWDYPGTSENTIWGTMNLLTTSQTSGTYAGLAYCNFSGTRGTTDCHSGSKAAIIETVGWGDNTAANTNPKNVTVGELYLGTYNSSTKTADYGYAYTHRPKSMEFWYKYTAKNSADYGYACIRMIDASGNVIASKETTLAATDQYTLTTLDLSDAYTSVGVKAAKIQIVFKSSGNPEATTKSTSWLSYPAFGNLSDGRFTGSELYIDDIKLNF